MRRSKHSAIEMPYFYDGHSKMCLKVKCSGCESYFCTLLHKFWVNSANLIALEKFASAPSHDPVASNVSFKQISIHSVTVYVSIRSGRQSAIYLLLIFIVMLYQIQFTIFNFALTSLFSINLFVSIYSPPFSVNCFCVFVCERDRVSAGCLLYVIHSH